MSAAELLLEEQLRQAHISFEREYLFARPRKLRADFFIDHYRDAPLLVEVDGGTWILGRHNRPSSIAKENEKGALAAIHGFRVIHCSTEQVEDGSCLSWIRQAMGLEEAA